MPIKKSITVVIPCYNEDKQIRNMVQTLTSIKDFESIVLVDDGSKPKFKKIYSELKDIKLITHEVNKGKLTAMHTGYKASHSDYILFLDADLINLTPNLLNKVIGEAQTGDFDAILLARGKDGIFFKKIGMTYLYAGERLIKRSFLERFEKEIFDGRGWDIEININKALLKYKANFKICELEGVMHTLKKIKYPLLFSIKEALKMSTQMVIRQRLLGLVYDYVRFRPFLKKIKFISAK